MEKRRNESRLSARVTVDIMDISPCVNQLTFFIKIHYYSQAQDQLPRYKRNGLQPNGLITTDVLFNYIHLLLYRLACDIHNIHITFINCTQVCIYQASPINVHTYI